MHDYDLIWEELIETAGNSPDIALGERACVCVSLICVYSELSNERQSCCLSERLLLPLHYGLEYADRVSNSGVMIYRLSRDSSSARSRSQISFWSIWYFTSGFPSGHRVGRLTQPRRILRSGRGHVGWCRLAVTLDIGLRSQTHGGMG